MAESDIFPRNRRISLEIQEALNHTEAQKEAVKLAALLHPYYGELIGHELHGRVEHDRWTIMDFTNVDNDEVYLIHRLTNVHPEMTSNELLDKNMVYSIAIDRLIAPNPNNYLRVGVWKGISPASQYGLPLFVPLQQDDISFIRKVTNQARTMVGKLPNSS